MAEKHVVCRCRRCRYSIFYHLGFIAYVSGLFYFSYKADSATDPAAFNLYFYLTFSMALGAVFFLVFLLARAIFYGIAEIVQSVRRKLAEMRACKMSADRVQ